ncbi:hypothetical protein K438DRAFT_1753620 [Mycena galopus ATCC 62051]|nr:hypothetical protein K438DRAFT_1753620 [Mycena galopus ATCC 62051]
MPELTGLLVFGIRLQAEISTTEEKAWGEIPHQKKPVLDGLHSKIEGTLRIHLRTKEKTWEKRNAATRAGGCLLAGVEYTSVATPPLCGDEKKERKKALSGGHNYEDFCCGGVRERAALVRELLSGGVSVRARRGRKWCRAACQVVSIHFSFKNGRDSGKPPRKGKDKRRRAQPFRDAYHSSTTYLFSLRSFEAPAADTWHRVRVPGGGGACEGLAAGTFARPGIHVQIVRRRR